MKVPVAPESRMADNIGGEGGTRTDVEKAEYGKQFFMVLRWLQSVVPDCQDLGIQ